MIRSVLRALVVLALLLGSAPLAALADPPAYDDPGMHFAAPPDFEKVDIPPTDPRGSDQSEDPTPVAAFVYHKGKIDQRVISISVARFDGPVSEFATSHITQARQNGDTFVAKNEKTTLQNGMPAVFLKVDSGATAGNFLQRFEYLVCDGTRSIAVAYVGPQGTFSEDAAKAALASLYVVVYPKRRP